MTPITVDMVAVTGATMVLMGISNKQHQLLQGVVVLVVVRLEVVGVAAGLHKLQVIERVYKGFQRLIVNTKVLATKVLQLLCKEMPDRQQRMCPFRIPSKMLCNNNTIF